MNTPVVALAGGVGGAKLALGLSKILPPEQLDVVVNTGDDEEFWGLHISPDLDTMMYTLAGVANLETGWGLIGDTFVVLENIRSYGVEAWFNIGDNDLSTHLRRTDMLSNGHTLSEVTSSLCAAMGVRHGIVPMSDDKVRTMVVCDEGVLPFQVYFVKRRCEPAVKDLRFDGADIAQMSPGFTNAIDGAGSLVICPSNPFLSLAPILAIPGVKERIHGFPGLRVAISPIVGGSAIRGPADKMLRELGHDVSCVGVARQYQGLCDVFVIDEVDMSRRAEIEHMGMRVVATDIVMKTDQDKMRLAQYICSLGDPTPNEGRSGGRSK